MVAMRDILCKGYDKLYGFLGYANMRLIPGYELGGKGCAVTILLLSRDATGNDSGLLRK